MKSSFTGVIVVLSLALPSIASAHIQLMSPTQRDTDQKVGACGKAGSVRGPNVTTYRAGETITVTWKETIPHPGHFRISFDEDGSDGFVDPTSYTDYYTGPSVILDNIADMTGTQTYNVQVTLPDSPCSNCTLQLIQVMTDKPEFGDGNDIYYQCADLILVDPNAADAGATPDAGAGDTNDDGQSDGCMISLNSGSGVTSGSGVMNALLLLGMIIAMRGLNVARRTRRD